MATRVVDTSSTFENWRQKYNDLATDVGSIGNLVTGDKSSVVNAINYLQDQYFFFQDFDYDGSDGATSNTVFSGADNGGNTLSYASGKVLVFKNGALLRSGTDYTATNGTSVTLTSSANNADVIRITSFTGSYQGVGGAAGTSGTDQWLLSGGVLYNKNTDGLIFNADSTINNSLDVSNSIQFENPAYFKDDVYINAQKDIKFRDADSSHYVAIQAPTTVSANVTLTLPTDDGTANQFLQTDGDGALTWATALTSAPTANDITVSANNSANETVYPVFVDGATGAQGIESDTGLTYNPSSGTLTSTVFVGALTGNVTGNVSGSAGSATGNAATATALATARTIAMTGDVVWSSGSFDGSGNVTAAATIQTDAVDIAMLSASGTASSSTFLRGDNSWVTPTDTNTTYSAGTGLSLSSTTFSNSGVTSIVAGSNVSISGATGAVTVTATDTNTTYSVGDGGLTQNNFTNADHSKLNGIADNATANTGDITGVTAGTYMSGGGSSGSVTLNHSDTSSQASVDNSGRTYIQDITLDGAGHVTAIASATETVTNSDTTYSAGSGIGLSSTTFSVAAGTHLTQDANGLSLATSTNLQVAALGVGAANTSAGTISAQGDITSNASSDIVLKENIVNIPNPLEKLSKIGGYMFDWKDHKVEGVLGKGHDTGIIAQEIEEILPEIVELRKTGIKAVNYMKLIPLLIESIKELKTELDELKSSNS